MKEGGRLGGVEKRGGGGGGGEGLVFWQCSLETCRKKRNELKRIYNIATTLDLCRSTIFSHRTIIVKFET